jgi:probable HAF family extracellular repeat protein
LGNILGFVPWALSQEIEPNNTCEGSPRITLRKLATLGGSKNEAWGINDKGHVVGVSDIAVGCDSEFGCQRRAFLWRSGVVKNLKTLGGQGFNGPESGAFVINNAGHVMGTSINKDDHFHGFRWKDGVMTDIGHLPAEEGFSFQSVPRAMNGRGQIVGYGDFGPDLQPAAMLWEEGRRIRRIGPAMDCVDPSVGGAKCGAGFSIASDINEAGQVVGHFEVGGPVEPLNPHIGHTHAFLWQAGKGTRDLGTLGGDHASAVDINEKGQIVGQADTADGESHAFLWDPVKRKMIDLGVLRGGNFSAALAINEDGDVVGFGNNGRDEVRAWLWRNGKMKDLGWLPGGNRSEASQIDADGRVYGASYDDNGTHSFVWDNGRMTKMPELGGNETIVSRINDRGQAVGWSKTKAGVMRAVRWTITSTCGHADHVALAD